MRRLDILVPHWQETPQEMEPLLDSIKLQRNIDFDEIGVIIAYDGPEASELPEREWQERYPYDIKFVHAPKGGVSATRNAAFDAGEGEYVTYCDADDMYLDVCGLSIVFREMGIGPSPQDIMTYGNEAKNSEPGFDLLISCFREETKDPDGKIIYVNHDDDRTFCHGKFMSRKFLVDNDIRYNNLLVIHEDSFFQILCRELAKPWRARYCPIPFYLWIWRTSSVCRHDKDYLLKTMRDMLKSNSALVSEFVKRTRDDLAGTYVAFMIFDMFYTLLSKRWRDVVNRQYREDTERAFAEYLKTHKRRWDSMSNEAKLMISNGVRQRHIMEGDMMLEDITIEDWLARIQRKYG